MVAPLECISKTNHMVTSLCCKWRRGQPYGPAKARKSGSEWEGPRSIVPRHISSPKENWCCQVISQILLIIRSQEIMQQTISLLTWAKERLARVPGSTMNVLPYKCRGVNMFLLVLIASFKRSHLASEPGLFPWWAISGCLPKLLFVGRREEEKAFC